MYVLNTSTPIFLTARQRAILFIDAVGSQYIHPF